MRFFLLLFPIFPSGIWGQDIKQFHFEHFGVQDGLISPFSYCSVEDQFGYIWIGTANGLFRSNGNSISQYQADADSPFSLKNAIVKTLMEDRRGNLWVGTQGNGVWLLGPERQILQHFAREKDQTHSISHDEILSFSEDVYGNIWIGTEWGVNVFFPETERISRILPDKDNPRALQASAALSLAGDQEGKIWIGSWDGGLAVAQVPRGEFEQKDISFRHYTHNPSDPGSIGGNRVWSIFEGPSGNIWFGLFGGGISMTNIHTPGEFVNVGKKTSTKHGLTDLEIFSVNMDKDRRLWVASAMGLSVSAPLSDTPAAEQVRKDLAKPWTHLFRGSDPNFSPVSNSIRDINMDRQGNLWLATEGGISGYFLNSNLFINHFWSDKPSAGSQVYSLCEAQDGEIWVGTSSEVFRYNLEALSISKPIAGIQGPVRALFVDEDQSLWIGTDHGLYQQPQNGRAKSIPLGAYVDIHCIDKGPDGNIWVGASGALLRINPKDHTAITTMIGQVTIYDLVWESDSKIWLGTEKNGLLRGVKIGDEWQTTSFFPHPSDPKSLINQNFRSVSLIGDQVWAGTTQGLWGFYIQSSEFISTRDKQGNNSQAINTVMPGPNNSVWIQASPGIAKWDKAQQTFIGYHDSHGIGNQNFKSNTMIELRDGRWVIGGENGLSIFNPNLLPSEVKLEKVTITNLSMFNKSIGAFQIAPYGNTPLFACAISELKEIQLNHRQSVLGIEFSTFDFQHKKQFPIRYRLAGLEDDWNYSLDKREATYTSLDPGTYRFEVSAANATGDWGPTTTLSISVEPPFWASPAFYFLIALLATGSVLGLHWWRTRLSRIRERQLSQMVMERTADLEIANEREREARLLAEEASKVKTSFLSTMSHEIRTPLNAVIGTSHLLLADNPRPDQEESLHMLHFSAKNLLSLINDILDFSKIEAGKLELESVPFNFKQLVRDVTNTLGVKAEEKNIKLRWMYPETLPEWFLGDQIRMSQVLLNLMGNAIKFTVKGEVCVQICPTQHGLQVNVRDTGIGIPLDRQEAIFEEFSQSSSSTTREFGGTGLGLAITGKLLSLMGTSIQLESTPGLGSRFFFDIDLPYAEATTLPDDMRTSLPDENLKGIHVLIAEDNIVNQKVIKKFMSNWDITCEIVGNGQKAVDAASKGGYDLILMDLNMPVMDGIEATIAIQGMGVHTPVLGLSAATLPEEVASMRSAGMIDVIPKPFDPKILRSKLITALAYSRSLAE
ncbi:MAG: ATP-binding protein [Bacteroidia bacterium]|nr:ATP-binding protein [Bacteroidia bacterium]